MVNLALQNKFEMINGMLILTLCLYLYDPVDLPIGKIYDSLVKMALTC